MPASPARAASTAALSARMFVWNAISSIVRMIFETFWLDSWMWLIDAIIADSTWSDSETRRSTSLISRAPSCECSAF